jgi:hypothetical protein
MLICTLLCGCIVDLGGELEVAPVVELDQTYFLLADDILLDKENPEQAGWARSVIELHEESGLRQTAGIRPLDAPLWPKGRFTYAFAQSVPQSDRAAFRKATQQYAAVSGLKFLESPTSGSYIYTIRKNASMPYGGLSTLGYTKNATMDYKDAECILHELGHGIGLHHEHQRPDRDSFIQVDWDAVPDFLKAAFVKIVGAHTSKPYDYESVMHYGKGSPASFSIKKTSLPTAGDPSKVGQRTYLSAQDKAFVAGLYPKNPHPVVGYVDGVVKENGNAFLVGWACARGLAQSIQVHLYRGGPAGGGGSFVGVASADRQSGTGIAKACGSSGSAHRFRIPLALSLRKSHAGEPLFVHGISPTGAANALLAGSGEHTIPADDRVLGYVDGLVVGEQGEVSVVGWACASGIGQAVEVHLYRNGPAGGGGTLVGVYTADQASEPAVAKLCSTTGGAHRFSIPLTELLRKDHAGEPIYVHGVSPTGTGNPPLKNSGKHAIPEIYPVIKAILFL